MLLSVGGPYRYGNILETDSFIGFYIKTDVKLQNQSQKICRLINDIVNEAVKSSSLYKYNGSV